MKINKISCEKNILNLIHKMKEKYFVFLFFLFEILVFFLYEYKTSVDQ